MELLLRICAYLLLQQWPRDAWVFLPGAWSRCNACAADVDVMLSNLKSSLPLRQLNIEELMLVRKVEAQPVLSTAV